MINELRMLIVIWLLVAIIKITPKTKDGLLLVAYIQIYLRQSLKNTLVS